MKEIRIHARAGQGAITTANILGSAYFIKGIYACAFPHFGAARMGAPMNAFVRVDTKPVRKRSQIYEPDCVIIVDSSLMRAFNCLAGLKDDGIAVIICVAGKQDCPGDNWPAIRQYCASGRLCRSQPRNRFRDYAAGNKAAFLW
jgi:2-oxoacid:acceptor oxidoreductase gamma subunit (pyruvate/2-ketoisovalerate family)